mmetsp:Transcript_47143/g.102692  ORF Transcript_47143/g.102692 Transcript_47143/m.102692 type:complete len:231 (+) Transcript_47143:239-931(+)
MGCSAVLESLARPQWAQAPERWSQLQNVVQNVFGETCETEAHSGGAALLIFLHLGLYQDVLPLLFSTAVDAALRAATDTLGGCPDWHFLLGRYRPSLRLRVLPKTLWAGKNHGAGYFHGDQWLRKPCHLAPRHDAAVAFRLRRPVWSRFGLSVPRAPRLADPICAGRAHGRLHGHRLSDCELRSDCGTLRLRPAALQQLCWHLLGSCQGGHGRKCVRLVVRVSAKVRCRT